MPRPIAVSKKSRTTYVLKDNRDDAPEDQVEFYLKPLPFSVRQRVMNSFGTGSIERAYERLVDVVRHGLDGWSDNYIDSEGEPVQCKKTPGRDAALTEDTVALLRDHDIVELGNEIVTRSQLSGDDSGN